MGLKKLVASFNGASCSKDVKRHWEARAFYMAERTFDLRRKKWKDQGSCKSVFRLTQTLIMRPLMALK